MKAVKLKLGTHMDSWLLYCVYQNQGQGPITLGGTSLDRFYNYPINEKKNVTLFSRTVRVTKLKPGTHIEWVDVFVCVEVLRPSQPKWGHV